MNQTQLFIGGQFVAAGQLAGGERSGRVVAEQDRRDCDERQRAELCAARGGRDPRCGVDAPDVERCRDHDLSDRPRDGDPSHAPQILDGKVQTDAKHQQNDADFRQLGRQLHIGHKPGCKRAHRNSRQQVAHQRRQPQAMRDPTADEGKRQAHGDCRNQRMCIGQFSTARERTFQLQRAGS